jgi:hypothetical protein
MKIYDSASGLVYNRQTLVIQQESSLSQELYYFLISSVMFQFLQQLEHLICPVAFPSKFD